MRRKTAESVVRIVLTVIEIAGGVLFFLSLASFVAVCILGSGYHWE